MLMVFIQIQSVTEEKKRLKADLDEAYKRHKEELEIQQLQHFQVNIGGEGENWLKKGERGIMSGLARREGLAVMQPNFFVCLKRGFTPPSPPLPSHQRIEAGGERRTNTICKAFIFLLPK